MYIETPISENIYSQISNYIATSIYITPEHYIYIYGIICLDSLQEHTVLTLHRNNNQDSDS